MKINVGLIGKTGECQSFHFSVPVDKVCDDPNNFWLTGKITVEGKVVSTGTQMGVTGSVQAKARQICHRCLNGFERIVAIPFAATYRENDDSGSADPEDESFSYQGDEIDLTELIRETLLLAEPLKALCSETCQGICPKCGVDRNVSPCSCDMQEIDPRFAALKQLFDNQ